VPAEAEKYNAAGKLVVPAREGGRLRPGESADLVILSGGRVERAMTAGRWVQSKVQP
jgi:imidazolonepropionase-like amidohydrolase